MTVPSAHGESRPLRVAYVTMQFPVPSETFAGTDVRVLREAGVEVEVFSMRPAHRHHERLRRERRIEDVPTWSLTAGSFLAALALLVTRPRWWLSLLSWVVRWQVREPQALIRCLALMPSALAIFARLRRRSFDVVHCFWGHYPALVGFLVQRFEPQLVSSVFLGAYDLDEDRYSAAVPGSAPVARAADMVCTHSRSNLALLRRLGIAEDKVRLVYRGVDLRAFPFVPVDDPEREDGLVVAVGSLIERKAMDDVLRAIARVRRTVPQVRLRVLGEGPERLTLEALARSLGLEDAVEFAGHVPSESIAGELRRATALTLLSKSDRIPNVVKEAMASGCPCVVSHTMGMDEIVVPGRTGYLVGIGDLDAAAEHLGAVLRSPRAHAAMVSEARALIVERFSAEASMAEYRRYWAEALEHREAGRAMKPAMNRAA